MMDILPLFYYPSTWIYTDDDKTLLKCMTAVFEEYNNVKSFQSSKVCLDFLVKNQSPLSKYNFLKSIFNDESYGRLQHTPIDFDVTMLASLVNDPNRHNEITALVIDYNMPEMDGFSLAQACRHLPMCKLLLTGTAQDSQVILGFNKSLIHRFVQKSQVDMEDTLISYLKESSFLYFQKISAPLLSYLETESQLPLSDPVFINFFKKYCEQQNINEYYLIDKQGSFLCLNKQGHRSCLIVHSDRSIDSWLLAYGVEDELPSDELLMVKNRKKIPFFGIGKEAWEFNPTDWPNYFYTPHVLQGRERYFWAVLNL